MNRINLDPNRINMIRLEHMNDTIKETALLKYFAKNELLSSSDVASLAKENISLVTIKRHLTVLTKAGFLEQSGAGRSVKYKLSKKGLLLRSFNVNEYLAIAPDARLKDHHFQFDIFEDPHIDIFSEDEISLLDSATLHYRDNAKASDMTTRKKELMRFIVEFSWKTSQIEGNTYDLISTEKLLLYGEESPGHTQHEAQMILNQKAALEFVLDNLDLWHTPSIGSLEELHALVGAKLDISKNLRKSLVGITGTNYRPLESEFQIRDALNLLFSYISKASSVYERALLSVLGVSYIQPFVDGNKRTSRLLGNAMLLADNYAPLSYRSVDDRVYKEACLVFYEQNSIVPFKQLFIDQYIFAANNYNIGAQL